MASIWELKGEWKQLYEMADDPDISPEVWFDTMEAIEGEIEAKADGYAHVVATLKGDIETIKKEEKRLYEKRVAIENSIDRMKKRLQETMETTGKTKFKTDFYSFGIQNNPPSVVMDEQYIENIPEEYIKYADPTVDKAKIKEDLKAGKNLEGIAHLEQTRGLRIR